MSVSARAAVPMRALVAQSAGARLTNPGVAARIYGVSSAALTTTGGIAAAVYGPSTAGQTTELDIPLLAVGPVQGPWEIANDDDLIANGG